MMDYIAEAIALGVDGVIVAICLQQYLHCKNAAASVRSIKIKEVDRNLLGILNESPDNKIDYAAIRGTVEPLEEPLRSLNHADITGVVRKTCVSEHIVARTSGGFWTEKVERIKETYNTVRFALRQGRYKVEVVDPSSANILDLEVVYDHFEPSVSKLADHVWGFATGIRQRGLQTTEEMLRSGTTLMGIGEISKSADGNSLVLQPPQNGAPFYLTTMSISSLLNTLDDRRRTYKLLSCVFSIIGIVLGGVTLYRYLKKRQEKRIAEELRRSLAESRKERRQQVRDTELREDQLCVVCRMNPREIVLIPCGHFCLCEDCSDSIDTSCPICRSMIIQKAAAYLS